MLRSFGSRNAVLLLALAGCDKLFSINEVVTPDSANSSCVPPIQGHDEDGDCVPDTVDNCPGIPNPMQAMTQGDLTGDVCDPSSTTVGDSILKLFAFEDAATIADWMTLRGRWVIRGDAAVSDDLTLGSEDHTYYIPARWGTPLALEAYVLVDQIGDADGEDYKVGIEAIGPDTFATDGYSCEIRRKWNALTSTHDDEIDAYSPKNGASSAPLVGSKLAAGTRYHLRMTLSGSILTCKVDGDQQDGGVRTFVLATPPMTEIGHVGMYTQATGVHVQYLAVYRLGP